MPAWLLVAFLLLYMVLALASLWVILDSNKALRDAKAQKGPF